MHDFSLINTSALKMLNETTFTFTYYRVIFSEFYMAGGSSHGGSSRRWVLPEYSNGYHQLRVSDPKEYYAGLRREWAF